MWLPKRRWQGCDPLWKTHKQRSRSVASIFEWEPMICEKFLKAERTWDLSVFAKAITNNFFDATNTRLASALTGPINQIRTASANERGVLINIKIGFNKTPHNLSVPCLLVMFILIRCFFVLKSCNDIICVGCKPEGDSQKIWNARESFSDIWNKKCLWGIYNQY